MKGKLQQFDVVVWDVDADGVRTGIKKETVREIVAVSEAQARRKVNAKLDEADIDVTEVCIRPFAG